MTSVASPEPFIPFFFSNKYFARQQFSNFLISRPLSTLKIIQNHIWVLSADIYHIKTKIEHFRNMYALIPLFKK